MQLFYMQPQAHIAENLSTLLSTLSASELVSKVTLLKKLLPFEKSPHYTNFTKRSYNSYEHRFNRYHALTKSMSTLENVRTNNDAAMKLQFSFQYFFSFYGCYLF